MTIQEAKEEIRAALEVYHQKDETGMYIYPAQRQRPVLLIGPPGIGKTAIMQQIARECGVGLVSYTMTHHTRQSAVGLPRIVEKEYEGEHFFSTQYTLSEIIASVYECREKTGCREGILFIDEINCVSETLAPVMLEFLQNKRFGNHQVPEGWMIVAAGNPSEYNKSARDFDVVTLDRVRVIEVEPDAGCWLSYAAGAGVHGAVAAYLTLHPERFFSIRQDGGKKRFVTARGWEDLSRLIQSYEKTGREVTPALAGEFLQDQREAAYFAGYYQIYRKYGQDYRVREILLPQERKEPDADELRAEKAPAEDRMQSLTPSDREAEQCGEKYAGTLDMMRSASLEERIAVVMQIAGVLREAFADYGDQRRTLACFSEMTEKYRRTAEKNAQADALQTKNGTGAVKDKENFRPERKDTVTELEALIRGEEDLLERRHRNYETDPLQEKAQRKTLALLQAQDVHFREARIYGPDRIENVLKQQGEELQQAQEERQETLNQMLGRAFGFLEEALGEQGGQERFLLTSSLAGKAEAAQFLSEQGDEIWKKSGF